MEGGEGFHAYPKKHVTFVTRSSYMIEGNQTFRIEITAVLGF